MRRRWRAPPGNRHRKRNIGREAATTIAADPSFNAVVVRSDPSTLAEVSELLESLDVRRTQVLIEAAIVEVAVQDRRDI